MKEVKNGYIEWECPSNIALVKYWGKKGHQVPMNPSLSLTLNKSVTRLQLEYSWKPGGSFNMEFLFDGRPHPSFAKRITDYLEAVTPELPVLSNASLKISSNNTFPHSAGIASSASSFGALALALCSMNDAITGDEMNQSLFFKKASSLARLGSGSACRSVYGGYVIWGLTDTVSGSGDEAACPISGVNPEFLKIRDSILIVSSGTKALSSSHGHKLMEKNPYAAVRYSHARENMRDLMTALNNGNMNEFIRISENEALTLHALMMTSSPGYVLLSPKSLEIIRKIMKFREETGLPAGFTLDAGPNVHLIYPRSAGTLVDKFVEDELKDLCENGQIINDEIGIGPERKK